MMYIKIKLEIHIANWCNLQCAGCSHMSDSGHSGVLTPEEFSQWVEPWSQRFNPKCFNILGGEPTINPHLYEIISLARKFYPQTETQITLTTNGYWLHKFPELPKVLCDTNTSLVLSYHSRSKQYKRYVAPIIKLIDKWRKTYPFGYKISQAWKRWSFTYLNTGVDALPAENPDIHQAWDTCVSRRCKQIFRGKLWKCPLVAYVHLSKEKWKDQFSSQWDKYLQYQPLDITCTDEELTQWFNKSAEWCCAACVNIPTSNPLVILK